MGTIFDLLYEIRTRPSMYVGYDDSKRVLQLQNLEMLTAGYSMALRNHHIQERISDFNREFGAYLGETKGWSVSCGPIAAVRQVAKSDEEAWELFWRLVDEFRAAIETR